jgi:hypothetical protein
MRVSIKRSFGRLLIAGVLAVSALTPGLAKGGGNGSEGYFPGITTFGAGPGFQGNSGGFQAREPEYGRPRTHSCDPYLVNPRPLYCR